MIHVTKGGRRQTRFPEFYRPGETGAYRPDCHFSIESPPHPPSSLSPSGIEQTAKVAPRCPLQTPSIICPWHQSQNGQSPPATLENRLRFRGDSVADSQAIRQNSLIANFRKTRFPIFQFKTTKSARDLAPQSAYIPQPIAPRLIDERSTDA